MSEARKGRRMTESNKVKLLLSRKRKVLRLEDNKIFDSLSGAAQDSNTTESSVSKACSGKLKRAGGFHWSYIN